MMSFPEFEDLDALGLAALLRNRELSAREAVDAGIERIEAYNPGLNAVIHRSFERARTQAETVDLKAPFAGVPFLVKDLKGEDAGQPCTSSSRALIDWKPSQDCELLRRYKRAGLLVLGRTNTPELGVMGVTEPELRGPTRNPWNPCHS